MYSIYLCVCVSSVHKTKPTILIFYYILRPYLIKKKLSILTFFVHDSLNHHRLPLTLDRKSPDMGKQMAFLGVFFSWEENNQRYFEQTVKSNLFSPNCLIVIATGDGINKVGVARCVKFPKHRLRTFTKLHLIFLKITKMRVKNDKWSRRQHIQSHLNGTLYLLYHVTVLFPFAGMLVNFCVNMGVYTFQVLVDP